MHPTQLFFQSSDSRSLRSAPNTDGETQGRILKGGAGGAAGVPIGKIAGSVGVPIPAKAHTVYPTIKPSVKVPPSVMPVITVAPVKVITVAPVVPVVIANAPGGTAINIPGPTGPMGPAGPTGLTGPAGPQG